MSALPPGWTINRVLENVPNPNFGTQYGQTYFTRWTYVCRNHLGQFVVSDGSEDACYQQALSLAATTGQANLP